MSALRRIYETCRPSSDVEAGTIKDEQFPADLPARVPAEHPSLHATLSTGAKAAIFARGSIEELTSWRHRVSLLNRRVCFSIFETHPSYGFRPTRRPGRLD